MIATNKQYSYHDDEFSVLDPNCLLSFFEDLNLHQKTTQLSCERSLPFLRLSGKQPFPGIEHNGTCDVWKLMKKMKF